MSVEKLGVTITASLTSSGPIFSAFFAYMILGGSIVYAMACILLVVLGSILIQLSIIHDARIEDFDVKHLVYPFASSIFGGIDYVAKKYGLNMWNAPV
ncbi:MAG: hypothetical protein QXQ29_04440 [Candidatus Bathyarchaeia archaeon]